MSGPKDYVFVYAAARLAEQRRRLEAMRQTRAMNVQTELSRARQRAASERAGREAQNKAAVEADLARRATIRQRELRAIQAMASETATSAHIVEATERTDTSVGTAEAAAKAQEIHREKSAELQGWADALRSDAPVNTFAVTEVANWNRRVQELAHAEPHDFSTVADALTVEAQAIHDRAGDLQVRFDTRNELLRDVIESMKEMGYFVSDPYFADPTDPASPVILKAMCGSESVTTSIDLSAMVKSVWDGQESEHCKETFFEFMDAMKTRGVALTPEREDLRERPILKQKGANELPRSADVGRTVGE